MVEDKRSDVNVLSSTPKCVRYPLHTGARKRAAERSVFVGEDPMQYPTDVISLKN